MPAPTDPKIYHVVHVDRLQSIVDDRHLWSDSQIAQRDPVGTTIGMNTIKERRLTELTLDSHPGLLVGECVPFYFCPRSVMLYLIHMANHANLDYCGGQGPIVHLEADLQRTVAWAKQNDLRWAFTLSNAGSKFFEDRADLSQLTEIDWEAVQADQWQYTKEGKQAEFLIEQRFPWELVNRIGVLSQQTYSQTLEMIENAAHRPRLEIIRDWYY